MNKILYIAEGEIEERFINFLKQNALIKSGQFKKFNLMQEKLKDNNSILMKKVATVYCILDTDITTPENISTLIFNLKKLAEVCLRRVFCLIQNKNFEDELKFILNCHDLGAFFKLPHNTTKDIKTYLAQTVNYRRHISRTNLTRYCSRSENFQTTIQNSKITIVPIEKCMN